MRFAVAVVAAAMATAVAGVDASRAQTAMDCKAEQPPGKPQMLRCGSGLTIVAESGAQFTLLDRNGDGRVDGVNLQRKAILIDAPKRKTGPQFEVVTPQAIAAVRGTTWAVDADGSKTSVFVETGRVNVRQSTTPGSVSLGPCDGVDVDASDTPLTVKRWPAPRVSALMARLGR